MEVVNSFSVPLAQDDSPLRHEWSGSAKRKLSNRMSKFKARANVAVHASTNPPVARAGASHQQRHQRNRHQRRQRPASPPAHTTPPKNQFNPAQWNSPAHLQFTPGEFVAYSGGVVMLYARNGRMCQPAWLEMPLAARRSANPDECALGWMAYTETLVCSLLHENATEKPSREKIGEASASVQKLLNATIAAEYAVCADRLAELRLCCAACRMFVLLLDGNAMQAAVAHIEMSLCLNPQTGALQLLLDLKRLLRMPDGKEQPTTFRCTGCSPVLSSAPVCSPVHRLLSSALGG